MLKHPVHWDAVVTTVGTYGRIVSTIVKHPADLSTFGQHMFHLDEDRE